MTQTIRPSNSIAARTRSKIVGDAGSPGRWAPRATATTTAVAESFRATLKKEFVHHY